MDDSQGKRKLHETRAKGALLAGALIVGMCIGVVMAERMYLSGLPPSVTAALSAASGAAGGRRAALQSSAMLSLSSTPAAPDHAAIRRSSARTPQNELEGILRREAPDGEVMVVISNMRMVTEKGLVRWLEAVRRAEVKHWVVVALDKELRDYCVSNKVPHFFRPVIIPESQSKTGSNHAISAMKYEILTDFIQLGWSVLLSDVDIVTVKNPWDHLYRDSDVEGMSDGWDDTTAVGEIYGIEDPSMGWSRYAQGYRLMALNSGLFYIRANERVLHLLGLIADRLNSSPDWDQSMFNKYIWTPSHGKYRAPQVSVRIMEPGEFMNSKTLFKFDRKLPANRRADPVMVHVNYHPDKVNRMEHVMRYYLDKDATALDSLPGGSEPGS